MPGAALHHVGWPTKLKMSGFGVFDSSMNGVYLLDMSVFQGHVYRREGAQEGGAYIAFDTEEGSWVLRHGSEDELLARQLHGAQRSPEGPWEGGGMCLGPRTGYSDFRSPVSHFAFPAPNLDLDFYNTNGLGPRPLLQHPGLVMLDCHSCSAWHVENNNDNGGTNSNNTNKHNASSDLSTPADGTRPFSLRRDRKPNTTPPCRVPGVFMRYNSSSVKSGSTAQEALRMIKKEKLMTILFSHGNGEDIGMVLEELAGFGERVQADVFAYEYEGYATSLLEGRTPSERGCNRAAFAAYAYLTAPISEDGLGIPPNRIVLFGRSIGSGPTLYLASQPCVRDAIAGAVLQSPIASGGSVLLGHVLGTSISAFDLFKNYQKLPLVNCPVAIMHGTCDQMVPIDHGRRLHEVAQHPVKPLWIDNCGHNDLPPAECEAYVAQFLRHLERKAPPSSTPVCALLAPSHGRSKDSSDCRVS